MILLMKYNETWGYNLCNFPGKGFSLKCKSSISNKTWFYLAASNLSASALIYKSSDLKRSTKSETRKMERQCLFF